MIDAQDLAQRYIASWNEAEPAARWQLVERLWAEDAHYADPMMQADGQSGIASLISDVHLRFPGHRFALTGQANGHGRYIRFCWSLAPGGGDPIARGTDFVTVAADGRLQQVTGFLDQVPGMA